MKIVKAEVFVTCPGRNFVTLKITTEDGITGLGDQELGFKAIRVQCGIPGMKTTYGMSKGKGLAYEPATKGQWPEEQLWSTEKYLDFMPKLFDAVRNKFGFNEHLLHDMHHRLTPIEAARFGKSIEDYRMFWMEDPTPAENQECFRLIRQHTVTPIAVGEVFNSIWDCKQLIEEQLIDYIRTTLTHAGGITGMRRIADFASLYQVRTGSHGPSDLSPVCMAAALHFDLWVPNFGVQEYVISLHGFPRLSDISFQLLSLVSVAFSQVR